MPHGPLAGTLAALSVLFTNVASTAPADARSASTPIRIVAFGDSLTAGYGLRPTEAFPARLQAALRAKGYDVTVANAGVSGNTTAAGLARVQRAVPGGTALRSSNSARTTSCVAFHRGPASATSTRSSHMSARNRVVSFWPA